MSWFGLKSKIPWDWRNGAIGAAGAVFLGLFLLFNMLGLGERFAELSFDFPYRFRPEPKPDEPNGKPDEAVIIYMDKKSVEDLKQFAYKTEGWARTNHAQLITNLTRFGAKVIVFDVLWTTLAPGDKELAEAMKTHGKVVVASSSQSEEGGPLMWGEERRPIDPIRSVSQYGIVEFPVGTDTGIRRQLSHPYYTNMAWKAAELFGRAPAHRVEKRWLNFYGPPKFLPSFSYSQLFDPVSLPDARSFSNKAVFVGLESSITRAGVASDALRTPYTAWARGELSPGVECQATAFLNLIRQEWLKELSQGTEIFIVGLIGILGGFGLILLRPWIAATISLLSFLAIAGVAVYLVWHAHFWFPWLIPGAVQIPVALGWAMLVNTRKVYHEKELLEESVATAKAAAASASAHHDTGSGPLSALSVINEAAVAARAEAPTIRATEGATGPDPRSIGDHELIRPIGKGAYGEVWLGRSLVGIYRAVKVVYRRNFEHPAPFEREFRGLKRFAPVSTSHPGFVQILHVGKNDAEGYFYYIMELGDDENSGAKIDSENYSARNLGKELYKRGKLPVAECAAIGIELAAALHCLHEHELIHRDIKPSNIIFLKGVAKLADIGLVTEIKSVPSEATYVGTPGYIAPEGPGSKAADIFSLGKVLFECAMGSNSQETPDQSPGDPAGPERETLLELKKIVSKARHPELSLRHASAAELQAELTQFQLRFKLPVSL